MMGYYYPFLLAYFILTSGLSFLETSCNPYIYCMGPEETATRRLNLAQAFNPIGALVGMWVAMEFIQGRMSPMSTDQRAGLSDAQFNTLKDHDLSVLVGPYMAMCIIGLVILVLVRLQKMPKLSDTRATKSLPTALKELVQIKNYREGVIAQFFYEGAQICCWTFIIQYGTRIFETEGMEEKSAELLAQQFNIAAMLCFAASRFICTWLLKFFPAGRMLSVLAILALSLTCGVILFPDRNGMYCLVGISACMSMMFPTIYGIALRGVKENVKYAGAGLIMSILGASVIPPIQALIIDSKVSLLGLSSANLSFVIPLFCFIVVAVYGHRAYVRHYIMSPGTKHYA
jgi:FHS family L-fucose permease-like MFS transporter